MAQKIILAIIMGAIEYVLLRVIFNFIMLVTLDCEALTAYDSCMMQDDQKVISNIVGTMFFEKFEYEDMRDYLMNKTT
jgi:hypothetical protein